MANQKEHFVHKHTLTVHDAEIDQWLAAQNNVSQSIALLIYRAIKQIGMQDYVLTLNELVSDHDLAQKLPELQKQERDPKITPKSVTNTTETAETETGFNNLGLEPK